MRIVSLLPSATEIVGFLGLTDALVGVSHECDYPAVVTDRPRVTSSIIPHGLTPAEIDAQVSAAVREGRPLYQVDQAALAELKPDLIVTQGICDVCAVSEGTVAHALDALPAELVEGVTVLSLDGRDFEGVLADILAVGEAAGVAERAAAAVEVARQRWVSLKRAQADGGPRVLMLEWSEPPFYGGHWVPEMVAAAGGVDPFGAVGTDSGRLTWEQVAEADPDVIVVMACGYGLEDNVRFARALYDDPAVDRLRALREERLWACDANSYFSRPAPRLVRGAELLAHIFTGTDEALPGEAVPVRRRS